MPLFPRSSPIVLALLWLWARLFCSLAGCGSAEFIIPSLTPAAGELWEQWEQEGGDRCAVLNRYPIHHEKLEPGANFQLSDV